MPLSAFLSSVSPHFKSFIEKLHHYSLHSWLQGYCLKIFQLNHITNNDLCHLDDLLCDHFLWGMLKNMKGISKPNWDYEDALVSGMMDLSRQNLWGNKGGQAHLEFEIAHKLCDHSATQETSSWWLANAIGVCNIFKSFPQKHKTTVLFTHATTGFTPLLITSTNKTPANNKGPSQTMNWLSHSFAKRSAFQSDYHG